MFCKVGYSGSDRPKDEMTRILQINSEVFQAAHHLMMATAAKLEADVILVSEPSRFVCKQFHTQVIR